MKRSVAILGPTPMFVRWAVLQACPLRELYPQRLPETTFRQLRAIREISLATIEHRVLENICIHPDARSELSAEALGIPIEEVMALVGGLDFVQQCCCSCPANAGGVSQPGLFAGCYGWLPSDLRFDFDEIIRGRHGKSATVEHRTSDSSLSSLIENAVTQLDLANQLAQYFPRWQPWWFGFWTQPVLKETQLELLEVIFTNAIDQLERAQPQPPEKTVAFTPSARQDLIRFRNAIQACRIHDLAMHVELIPPGNSDGLCWTLVRHCGICKNVTDPNADCCAVCGAVGDQQNEIKLKVLGLRPYLRLASIFGMVATENLLRQFELK